MTIIGRLALLAVAFSAAQGQPDGARKPVLLELFTSQGCSSCPPADRLLAALDRTQPHPGLDLIVLSEHVDYWNRLGWADPYSSPEFSRRQQRYSALLRLDTVYTPQLVIDGRLQGVGSDAKQIHALIRAAGSAPKLAVALENVTRAGGSVKADLRTAAAAGRVSVIAVLAEDRAETAVQRGENAGRRLSHVAVVRSMKKVADLERGQSAQSRLELPVPQGIDPGRVRLVVFLQDSVSGHVLGASMAR